LSHSAFRSWIWAWSRKERDGTSAAAMVAKDTAAIARTALRHRRDVAFTGASLEFPEMERTAYQYKIANAFRQTDVVERETDFIHSVACGLATGCRFR
jgi:hypothetical protein